MEVNRTPRRPIYTPAPDKIANKAVVDVDAAKAQLAKRLEEYKGDPRGGDEGSRKTIAAAIHMLAEQPSSHRLNLTHVVWPNTIENIPDELIESLVCVMDANNRGDGFGLDIQFPGGMKGLPAWLHTLTNIKSVSLPFFEGKAIHLEWFAHALSDDSEITITGASNLSP